MKIQDKKVLVTGADGFIGSHLTEELVRLGCKVRAFTFYNSFGSLGWLDDSPPEIKDSIEIFSGDIRDPYGVRNAVKGCNLIFHLAALIAIPFSYHSPDTYIDTNIKGTLSVLQASRDLEVEKLVHTSTSEVYGTAQFVPITEEHPLQGQSPYSASKIGADQLALSFYRSFGTPVSVIRPFNTYGPRQSARAVIPTIITQLADGKTKIRLGSLSPTRDFNFVDDTVSGFIAVSKAESSIGQVINIGSNYEISIGELVDLTAELMGKKIEVETEEIRLRPEKSEVERLWADNSKAMKLLGWSPNFAGKDGLRKGLQKTIDWFCQPENQKKFKSNIYNI